MIRDCPVLTDKVKPPRERDSGNTVLHKVFTGGHISLVGSNSTSSLASRPIRVLLLDEVDRFEVSANEGDVVSLAVKRTTTFWNNKIIMVSTPTIKGLSRIEQEYNLSDKRKFYVPCPECKELQVLNLNKLSLTKINYTKRIMLVDFVMTNGTTVKGGKLLDKDNGNQLIILQALQVFI